MTKIKKINKSNEMKKSMHKTMSYIPLRDGEKMNVICIGKGEPVVLVHGFGSCAAHWLANILPFIHQYRFYLPDLRGFAGSHASKIPQGSVFETYAHDLEDLFNHFQLENISLGGISTGAYTCLTYNQIYGFDRIKKYLNIEHGPDSKNSLGKSDGLFGAQQERIFTGFKHLRTITAPYTESTPYWELPADIRLELRNTFMALIRRALNRSFSRRVVEFSAQYGEPLLTQYMFAVENWHTYLDIMDSFVEGGDRRPSLSKIQVPTTLMIGQHSRYFEPETQLEMAKYIPNSKVVMFEKSGHILPVDQPVKFQREFAQFILTK